MHFLATIAVTVAVWILDVFEEYIVGLMLLLAWIVLGIVPSKVALAGVLENSWFLLLDLSASPLLIGQTGLLRRLALRLFCWIPIDLS